MSAKKTDSGLGARMAAAAPVSAVAAGFAAATGSEAPEAAPQPPAKAEVVALNIRLPKALHRTLREIAFKDETSINAILIQATEEWLSKSRG